MSTLQRSRLIVGLLLIVMAIGLFAINSGYFATAGLIAIGMLGLILIAISRRK